MPPRNWATLLALAFTLFLAHYAHAQSVEEFLEKINRLPTSERQQRLAEGARKEGELVWYSTMNRENSQELINLFQKEHPYVQVKLLNGSAVQTMTRLSSEYSGQDLQLRHHPYPRPILNAFTQAPNPRGLPLAPARYAQADASPRRSSIFPLGWRLVPKQTASIYCASKAALHSFSKTLRWQLEGTAVKVFEVLPSIVDTAMTAGRGRAKISPDRLAEEF